jgi:hypothetical protein
VVNASPFSWILDGQEVAQQQFDVHSGSCQPNLVAATHNCFVVEC